MARARNLKASFFTDDEIATLVPLGRLLFQGLWCHADREGRLEERPKRLKAEILPYDNCNIEKLLQELDEARFIIRYQYDGRRYIQVRQFKKHQNPHIKEPPSTIPAPCEHRASTVQEPEEHETKQASARAIPERARLIVDSGFPLPDSVEVPSEIQAPERVAIAPPAKPIAENGRGTRLDPLWVLPQPWAEWALCERKDWTLADVELVGLQFRDHWHAKAGKDARKADWLAAWRTWVRNERRNYRDRPNQAPPLAERRSNSMGMIGKGSDGRIINGVAERMDSPALRAIPVDLRERGGREVRIDLGRSDGSGETDGRLDRDMG